VNKICKWLPAGGAFQFDTTPFHQTLEAEKMAAIESRFVLVRTHANSTLTGVVIQSQRTGTSGGNGIRLVTYRQVDIIDWWIVN
jgi:hypothetical protein